MMEEEGREGNLEQVDFPKALEATKVTEIVRSDDINQRGGDDINNWKHLLKLFKPRSVQRWGH